MSTPFSDDDIGKVVENGNGEPVGIVAAVEDEIVHVRPDPSAVESIKSSLGWEGVVEKTVRLDRTAVRDRTADTVRLEGTLPAPSASGPRNGNERGVRDGDDWGRGASAEPTEDGEDE